MFQSEWLALALDEVIHLHYQLVRAKVVFVIAQNLLELCHIMVFNLSIHNNS